MHFTAADGKEDGAATLAAVRLAVEQLVRDFPDVKRIPFVKTDGAGAYAGADFTVGLTTLVLPVLAHFIGCSGNNKTAQDTHFAVLGQGLDLQVDSGEHDADGDLALYQGIARLRLKGVTSMLFTPDRSYTINLQHIHDLSKARYARS